MEQKNIRENVKRLHEKEEGIELDWVRKYDADLFYEYYKMNTRKKWSLFNKIMCKLGSHEYHIVEVFNYDVMTKVCLVCGKVILDNVDYNR